MSETKNQMVSAFGSGLDKFDNGVKNFFSQFISNIGKNLAIMNVGLKNILANVASFINLKLVGKDQICVGKTCVDEEYLLKVLDEKSKTKN